MVMDTRDSGENIIRRRRKCLDCNYRFTTLEANVEDIAKNNRDLYKQTVSQMKNFIDKALVMPAPHIQFHRSKEDSHDD